MNKYISFLLVPIMLFGINSNSCYSMFASQENNSQDKIVQTNDNNANIVSRIHKLVYLNYIPEKSVAKFVEQLQYFFTKCKFSQEVSNSIKKCIEPLLSRIEKHRSITDDNLQHYVTNLFDISESDEFKEENHDNRQCFEDIMDKLSHISFNKGNHTDDEDNHTDDEDNHTDDEDNHTDDIE